MADSLLTTLIERTHADPALARDLLDATQWDLEAAVSAYHSLYDTAAVEPEEYQYNPKDFESLTGVPEDVDTFSEQETKESAVGAGHPVVDDNEAKRRELVKHQRQKRGRGLSFPSEEVVDKFNRVAVSTEKVSAKEQVTFDEKFFHHSFVYPDLSSEGESLQEFIAADLVEVSMKKALERLGRLNWWSRTGILPSLEPLATSGDGNCLLHAASLYMWGFHDRELILRTALHRTLTTGLPRLGIKRRWKYHTQLRYEEIGLQFTDEEWDFEWGDVIRIATNQTRQQPTTASLRRKSSLKLSYESLEEIHVFALAHVLKRAVIVISDRTIKSMTGEDLAPIYFGGIYLPFEINPTACHKCPIVLCYDSSHFAPLVAKEDKKMEEQRQKGRFSKVSGRKDTVVPLVTPNGSLLPVQFAYDPENKMVTKKWARSEFTPGDFPDEIVRLLEPYLDVRWIQLKADSITASVERSRSHDETSPDPEPTLPIEVPKVRFPAAHIKQQAQPIYQKELIEKYLDNARSRYEEHVALKAKRAEEKKRKEDNQPVPCVTEGCDMFGKKATDNLCSVCYRSRDLERKERSGSTHSDDKEFFDPSTMNSRPAMPISVGENSVPAQAAGFQWPASESPQDDHRPLPKQTVAGPSLSKQSAPRPQPHPSTATNTSPSKTPILPPQSSPSKPRPQPHPSTVAATNTSPSKAPMLPPQSSPSKPHPQSHPPASQPQAPKQPSVTTPNVTSNPKAAAPKNTSPSVARNLRTIPPSPVKKPVVSRGYSRDGIQPISLGGGRGRGSKVVCKNAGCEFFGNEDKQGFCSKCFNEQFQTA